jgi:hypothetical protein
MHPQNNHLAVSILCTTVFAVVNGCADVAPSEEQTAEEQASAASEHSDGKAPAVPWSQPEAAFTAPEAAEDGAKPSFEKAACATSCTYAGWCSHDGVDGYFYYCNSCGSRYYTMCGPYRGRSYCRNYC